MAAAVHGRHGRMLVSSSSGNNKSSNPPPINTKSNECWNTKEMKLLQQSTPFASANQSSMQPSSSYLTSSHQYSVIQHQGCHSKRKSAVELLAESKPFYVKSDTVRDRQQKLNIKATTSPACTLSPSRHNRRSASSGSDLLQTKLRKLLNTTDNKDSIKTDSIVQKYHSVSKRNSFSYQLPKLTHELTVYPDSQNDDVSVFFPSAFLSPQSLPPHPVCDDDLYSYGIDDGLELTDDYCAISPPAEYAEIHRPSKDSFINNRYGYQRSHSHSQTVVQDPPEYSPSYNINSHKSLPDLHSQISRHSPHSEALSCCSRGNRSNKSSSSFNRDSGGSSGHYTHHSEPCGKQKEPIDVGGCEFRRDSGSSTQHSGNSYYNYGTQQYRFDCIECKAKLQKENECLLNFTTPEVPEAFQDNYKDKSVRYYDESSRQCYSSKNKTNISPDHHASPQKLEHSPPLGTFKRQKCLRFKHRGRFLNSGHNSHDDDRRPILRSKSDICDRYWNRTTSADGKGVLIEKRGKSESMSQLERFFDRLGLNDETYDQYIAPDSKSNFNSDDDSDHSSAVFFSDVSTVDSNRIPPDNPETTKVNGAMYRPSEPPSIVERNARIIKWLCNCKKLQLA